MSGNALVFIHLVGIAMVFTLGYLLGAKSR